MGRYSFFERTGCCFEAFDNLLVLFLQLSQSEFADVASIPIFFNGELECVLHVLAIAEIDCRLDLVEVVTVTFVVSTQQDDLTQFLVVIASRCRPHLNIFIKN